MFLQSIAEFFKKNYRSLLRLTVILCIYWLCIGRALPGGPPEYQDGIGGGSQLDTLIPENPDLSPGEPEIHEAGISEPEYFSKPHALLYSTYVVSRGDQIGNIATAFGLNQGTLISVNNIKNTRVVQIGQVLKIPNQDGVLYTVNPKDTLSSIAAKYKADISEIKTVNELFSDSVQAGLPLFIPGAQLDRVEMQEINGDLFTWPVRGRITSYYGYRSSPFTGIREFHSGLDIGSPYGTPIRAAMPGRVSAAGWDNSFGNYVIISHHSGYRTLYGHMSVIRVKPGAYVGLGERIGDVGTTGLSTGAHLHFTVYKNGRTVNPLALMR